MKEGHVLFEGHVWKVTTLVPEHSECVVLEAVCPTTAYFTPDSILPGALVEVPKDRVWPKGES